MHGVLYDYITKNEDRNNVLVVYGFFFIWIFV